MSYTIDTRNDLVTTVHDAVTATVTLANTKAVDCSGYNAITLYAELGATGTPNSTTVIYSSDKIDGTYSPAYDGTLATDKALTTGALTASRVVTFRGIGNFVKPVITVNSGTATHTIKVQPVNI